VAADIAGPANNKDRHRSISSQEEPRRDGGW
jgi:hypothetical protein